MRKQKSNKEILLLFCSCSEMEDLLCSNYGCENTKSSRSQLHDSPKNAKVRFSFSFSLSARTNEISLQYVDLPEMAFCYEQVLR